MSRVLQHTPSFWQRSVWIGFILLVVRLAASVSKYIAPVFRDEDDREFGANPDTSPGVNTNAARQQEALWRLQETLDGYPGFDHLQTPGLAAPGSILWLAARTMIERRS